MKPTQNGQFLTADFAGFGGGYSGGLGYGAGVDFGMGGNLIPSVGGTDKLDPSFWGKGVTGYRTSTLSSGFSGPGFGVGAMYNYGRTFVW